jgi:hypothetical protein
MLNVKLYGNGVQIKVQFETELNRHYAAFTQMGTQYEHIIKNNLITKNHIYSFNFPPFFFTWWELLEFSFPH